jgi:hypothetical protein
VTGVEWAIGILGSLTGAGAGMGAGTRKLSAAELVASNRNCSPHIVKQLLFTTVGALCVDLPTSWLTFSWTFSNPRLPESQTIKLTFSSRCRYTG